MIKTILHISNYDNFIDNRVCIEISLPFIPHSDMQIHLTEDQIDKLNKQIDNLSPDLRVNYIDTLYEQKNHWEANIDDYFRLDTDNMVWKVESNTLHIELFNDIKLCGSEINDYTLRKMERFHPSK